MGATNCPETPRQRMISMMYLVLTAMLALNVSKNILDAFSVIDEATQVATATTESTIRSNFSWLEMQKVLKGEEKVGVPLRKLGQLKGLSDGMVEYITTLRNELLVAVDKDSLTKEKTIKAVKDIGNKDNISNATNYIYKEGRATKLKEELIKFRKSALNFVNEKYRESVGESIGLEFDGKYTNNDGQSENWETHNFNGTILAADVTMLNKIIGEVRTAQAAISKSIIDEIEGDNFKFDNIGAAVIPMSKMVFRGQGFNADVVVSAYDSKIPTIVYYKMGIDSLTSEAGATQLESVNGVVKLNIPTGSTGEQRFAGFISVVSPDGTRQKYYFKDKYTVVEPMANITAEKMNVLYVGIENPLTVSAAGVSGDKINLSIEGCTVSKTGSGKYNVIPGAGLIGKEVMATASASGDKTNTNLGSTKFRVRAVPAPRSRLGSAGSGSRSKNEILANPKVIAKMDESFVYDLVWTITSYQVYFIEKGMEVGPLTVQGNNLSPEIVSKINAATPRTTMSIRNIRASSPAGVRPLDDIVITIK